VSEDERIVKLPDRESSVASGRDAVPRVRRFPDRGRLQLEPIPQFPLARSAGEGSGVRVARIAAGFLNRFRRSLALTPTLSQRERGTLWNKLLADRDGAWPSTTPV